MSNNYKNGNGGGKKEFAPSVGFWPTKSGSGYSVFVDDKTLETIKQARSGDRLFLAEVPEEKRGEKTPHYRLTILPGDDNRPTAAASNSDGAL